MKGFLISLLMFAVVANAINLRHMQNGHKQSGKTKAKVFQIPEGLEVECENFDTYASCPGGWPMIDAVESQHRVRCCGATSDEKQGGCAMCSRCKVGSFADGCCTCDDDEVVDAFWQALKGYHSDSVNKDGAVIGQRELIDLISSVKGEMTPGEELIVKDAWENIMKHALTADQKTTSGLAYTAPISTYLRENPDVVNHLLGETESPSEGEKQLAFDHSSAQMPEWSSGMAGKYAGHLPPEIIRQTKNGLWEVLVPNFVHPSNGYYPAVYRHSRQEATAYAAEKKAEYMQQEANQAMATHNARAKASENVDLVHHDRQDGHAGFKKYNDQTSGEQSANLVGLVEKGEKGAGDDLAAAINEVNQKTAALEAQANAPGAVSKITTTHVESTDVRVERAVAGDSVGDVTIMPNDQLIDMDGSGSEGSDGSDGSDGSGSGSDEAVAAAFLEMAETGSGSGSAAGSDAGAALIELWAQEGSGSAEEGSGSDAGSDATGSSR